MRQKADKVPRMMFVGDEEHLYDALQPPSLHPHYDGHHAPLSVA